MQALMIAVTQQWGRSGFQEHCSKMQHVYQNRANIMHQAAVRVCPHTCVLQLLLKGLPFFRGISKAPDIPAPKYDRTSSMVHWTRGTLRTIVSGVQTLHAASVPVPLFLE